MEPATEPVTEPATEPATDHREATEIALWQALREDPNDVSSFHALAEMVRGHAAESHTESSTVDLQRAMDDAVWSLAEELAHSGRAWYPLVELARLSLYDDREAAMRRLGTAVAREPTGLALATALDMLRQAGLPGEALNLGMGAWRPREHLLVAGRHMVESAIEAARLSEARRHLEALEAHPEVEQARAVREDLAPLIEAAQAAPPPPTPSGGLALIDLRDLRAETER